MQYKVPWDGKEASLHCGLLVPRAQLSPGGSHIWITGGEGTLPPCICSLARHGKENPGVHHLTSFHHKIEGELEQPTGTFCWHAWKRCSDRIEGSSGGAGVGIPGHQVNHFPSFLPLPSPPLSLSSIAVRCSLVFSAWRYSVENPIPWDGQDGHQLLQHHRIPDQWPHATIFQYPYPFILNKYLLKTSVLGAWTMVNKKQTNKNKKNQAKNLTQTQLNSVDKIHWLCLGHGPNHWTHPLLTRPRLARPGSWAHSRDEHLKESPRLITLPGTRNLAKGSKNLDMPRAPPCFLIPSLAPGHHIPSLCKVPTSSKSFNFFPLCLPSFSAELFLQTLAPTWVMDRTLIFWKRVLLYS